MSSVRSVTECNVCGKTHLTRSCNHCGKTVCTSHILPENHNCVGVRSANTLGPEFRQSEESTIGDGRSSERDSTTGSAGNPGTRRKARNETPTSPGPAPRLQGVVGGAIGWVARPRGVTVAVFSIGVLIFAAGSAGVAPFAGVVDATEQEVSAAASDAGEAWIAATNDSSTPTTTPAVDSSDGVGGDSGSSSLNQTKVQRWVHYHINKERQAEGLPPLSYDSELGRVADEYAELMADTGHYGHTGPEGSTFEDRYKDAGYQCEAGRDDGDGQYYTGAENILYTYYEEQIDLEERGSAYYADEQELARGMVNSWMNSAGHRENIMMGVWDDQGIGIGVAEEDGATKVYAVQNFC